MDDPGPAREVHGQRDRRLDTPRAARSGRGGWFPETSSAKWQVSTAGGSQPVWSKSGRQLYYLSGKNELVAADIRPGATFAVGEQRALWGAVGK
jgi:hypothetical protein